MGWRARIIGAVIAATLSGCGSHRKASLEAETAGPQFANLCIERSKWPLLIRHMKEFAGDHGLSFHGGVDEFTPDRRPQFNAYLSLGYSYFFGDDFDLWFTSDPFREDVVTLGGIVKNQPTTQEQRQLANDLLVHIKDITAPARGPLDNPNCAPVTQPGNDR